MVNHDKRLRNFIEQANEFYRAGGVEMRWRIQGHEDSIDRMKERRLFEMITSAN